MRLLVLDIIPSCVSPQPSIAMAVDFQLQSASQLRQLKFHNVYVAKQIGKPLQLYIINTWFESRLPALVATFVIFFRLYR